MFDASTAHADVLLAGEALEIDPITGRIMQSLNPKDQLTIRVSTGPGEVIAFTSTSSRAQNRPNAVNPLRDYRKGEGGHTFRLKLSPIEQHMAAFVNRPHANRIRLAWIDGSEIVLWQAAVVYHGDQAFLHAAEQRREQLVRFADGLIKSPVLAWPELMKAITPLAKTAELTGFADFVEPEEFDPSNLADGEAYVQWYDPSLGMGVALINTGENVAIFADDVVTPTGQYAKLPSQEIVYYAEAMELADTWSFPAKLIGVQTVSLVTAS